MEDIRTKNMINKIVKANLALKIMVTKMINTLSSLVKNLNLNLLNLKIKYPPQKLKT